MSYNARRRVGRSLVLSLTLPTVYSRSSQARAAVHENRALSNNYYKKHWPDGRKVQS